MECEIIFGRTDGKIDKTKVNAVKAPNGKRSLLYDDLKAIVQDDLQALEYYYKTQTEQFKNWFGNGQADANGQPSLIDGTYVNEKGDVIEAITEKVETFKQPKTVVNNEAEQLEQKDKKTVADLEKELVNGFLKDFGITVNEYDDLKDVLGINASSATDLVTKTIAYQKGESILPEVAYLAYKMLGKKNSKIAGNMKYLISNWDKYRERFDYHVSTLKANDEFYANKALWKDIVRDKVIVDFLTEMIVDFNENPTAFNKINDTRWTKEDFSLLQRILKAIVDFLEGIGLTFTNKAQKVESLKNIARTIANEVLSRNYEYYNYNKN